MAQLKLKKLEHYLQEVQVFEQPKIKYEQYTTTPHLSANILHTIQSRFGDLEGKIVADLGCGCGILSIGSLLLGATHCFGFDIDPDALAVCQTNVYYYDLEDKCEMITCDIENGLSDKWNGFFDTVVMNPPFGTRNKGVDSEFVRAALRLGNVVYSLHKSSTREYFKKKSVEWNVDCSILAQLRFDLPATYKFHNEKSVDISVDVIRFENK